MYVKRRQKQKHLTVKCLKLSILKFLNSHFQSLTDRKKHLYEVSFSDGTSTQVTSYARKEKSAKESLRLRVGKSTKEGGKIDFPVIFLGLKRLIPLAQERKVDSIVHSLTQEELDFYKKLTMKFF